MKDSRYGPRPGPQRVSYEQVLEIVRLREEKNQTFQQIATVFGLSAVAIFKQYHRWVLWARERKETLRMTRKRLPVRRKTETFEFEHTYPGAASRTFTAHTGFYDDGTLGEIFVSLVDGKQKLVTVDAHDTCIVLSFALQHGADLEAIRRALLRGSDGTPHGFLGSLIDSLQKGKT